MCSGTRCKGHPRFAEGLLSVSPGLPGSRPVQQRNYISANFTARGGRQTIRVVRRIAVQMSLFDFYREALDLLSTSDAISFGDFVLLSMRNVCITALGDHLSNRRPDLSPGAELNKRNLTFIISLILKIMFKTEASSQYPICRGWRKK